MGLAFDTIKPEVYPIAMCLFESGLKRYQVAGKIFRQFGEQYDVPINELNTSMIDLSITGAEYDYKKQKQREKRNRNILKKIDFEELKLKINKILFSKGGYFGGYETIEVIKNNNSIECKTTHSLKKKKGIFEIPIKTWDEFLSKIFNQNILDWKSSYCNDNICDGEQWELEIYFNGLPSFVSSGSNDYPENWENFCNVINQYLKKKVGNEKLRNI